MILWVKKFGCVVSADGWFDISVGTIDFSSEITIPPNFTAERAENAETLEKTSGV